MKTKLFITSFWLLLVMCSWAQKGIINNGAKIIITSNAFLDINGGSSADYHNYSVDASNQGRIDLQGKIKIEGDWYNQASGGNVFINSATDGEIVFDGSTQQIIGGSAQTYFEKVTLNNNQGILLSVNTLIKGNFTFTSGLMKLDSYNLYLDTSVTIGGTPSSSAMILPNSSGSVYKYFKNAGSFTFPVGDTLSTDEYSPLTLTFNSGTFGASAYAKLNVFNQKHPNNASSTSYLNRYWNVTTSNISGYSADVSAYYSNTDIAGTEGNIYLSRYNSPYWDRLDVTNTALNKLSASSLSSMGDFTGAESSAVTPAIALNYDGLITEGAENNEVITITLANDDFVASLNTSNWTISNLPQGVSKGTLTRTGNKTATISLTGNRTKDFDSNITNVTISIAAAELVHTSSGNLSASSGVIITATNDTESIVMADDGLITEGSENGEIITVTAVGGTFASSLTPANWVLTNLPTGVSKGSVTRVNATTVQITLSGSSSVDYDTDITNASLSVSNAEIDEYAGVNLTVSTGVTFKAIDESLTITMTDDGSITEGSENGESIVVTISGRTFTTSLTPSNWILSNLPEGVTKGSVTRNSSTQATILLSGSSTKDFDSDISNISLQINPGEIDSYSSTAFITSGVTIHASDYSESISISDNGINEGAEDGRKIFVTLTGGTFSNTLNPENWTVTNLPLGVTMGSVIRNSSTSVEIVLNGNRCCDYDNTITNVTVNISEEEVDDYTGADLSDNTGVSLIATNDNEWLTMVDDGEIIEGNEEGEIITVTLTGGDFVNPIIPANWELTNLPSGVTIGNVTRQSNTEVSISLVGNSIEDYDTDITNAALQVSTLELNDTTGTVMQISSGITFSATDEPVLITLLDQGIEEAAENGALLTIVLSQDSFVGSLNSNNWTVTNLPVGVSVGSISRISNDTVQISLSGNRTTDYDSDITDVMVTIDGNELVQHNSVPISQNSGIIFNALNDAESIQMTDDGSLLEDAESGEIITVTLQGGTFSTVINPSNWNLTGLPDGVSVGSVNRINDTKVELILNGNATSDYDADITMAELIVNEAEIDDYTEEDLIINTGIIFTASIESIDIQLSSDGFISENAENSEIITVSIFNDAFVPSLNSANWELTNLPDGVLIDSISRVNDSLVVITLKGNRTKDYDSDITNLKLTIQSNEFIAQTVEVSTMGGVIFVSNNDDESIVIYDNGDISEGDENGKSIFVDLVGGTFTNYLDLQLWSISNLPEGVSAGSLFKSDINTVEVILTGNSTNDYDVAISTISVGIHESQLDDYTGADLVSSTGVTITAHNESLTITGSDLEEDNLNGMELLLTLTDDKLIDNNIDIMNISLLNAPTGVSVNYIEFIDENNLKLYLYFDGTDFDEDISDFSISIDESELFSIADIYSNELFIDANYEATQVVMYDFGIFESYENGEQINVVVTQNQFVSSLNFSNWSISNLPDGVTIGSYFRLSTDTVLLYLSGNRTRDYDTDITNLELVIAASEFVTETPAVTALSEVILLADNDTESILVSDSGINEGAESGEQLFVTLDGGTFVPSLNKTNWGIEGLPGGVTFDTIIKTDSIHAIITLAGNAQIDYDTDITGIKVFVSEVELDDYSGSSLYSDGGILFKATNDDEVITISDDGSIVEGAESGEIISVNLMGGTFTNSIENSKWDIFNLPEGVSVSSLERVNNQQVNLVLNGNRTIDYDESIYNFSVNINGDQIDDFSNSNYFVESGVVFNALTEKAFFTNTGISEETLKGALLNLELQNETFIDNQLLNESITLMGLPKGAALDSVYFISSTRADLSLSFDGTDFDSTVLISVIINNSVLSSNTFLSSDTLEITATNDEELITMTDDGNILEGSEEGEIISVNLTGGTFSNPINSIHWGYSNLPNGVYFQSIIRDSDTSVSIVLGGNTSQDYDTDISNFALQIGENELNDYTGPAYIVNSGVTFLAKNESLTIQHSGLTELNLNRAEIQIELINEVFTDESILNSSINLFNAPEGLYVFEVTYISQSAAIITLGFEGADFDTDITEFYISIDESELAGNANLVSNNLMIQAIQELQTAVISHHGLNESNLHGASVDLLIKMDKFIDDQLNSSNFSLNNYPTGTSISSVTFKSDTTAEITLSFNGTDFDSDYSNFSIGIAGSEFVGNSGIISNTLNILATNDTETITMYSDGNITEGSEEGESITFEIEGGTFVQVLSLENWIFNNLPSGVLPNAISRLDNHKVQIILMGNSNMDYDQDITNLLVQVNQAEFDDYIDQPLEVTGGVVFESVLEPDPKFLTISHSGLNETNLDGAIINAQLIADFLTDQFIDPNNVILLNTPPGTSIDLVQVSDSVNFTVILQFDGTDFDSDFTNFQISLMADELNSEESIISNELQIQSVNELQKLIITNDSLFEANLQGSIIHLTLQNDQFLDTLLDSGNFSLLNAPVSLAIDQIHYLNDTAAEIILSIDSIDFDTDFTNFSILLSSNETTSGLSILSNNLTIRAENDSETFFLSSNDQIIEGNENSKIILLTLSGGTFNQTITQENWIFENLPQGVTMGDIERINSKQVILTLVGNSELDYDTDIVDFTIILSKSEFFDYQGNPIEITGGIVFEAIVENPVLVLLDDGLTENNLNGAFIQLKLKESSFDLSQNNNPIGITLNNSPEGLGIQSYSITNDSMAVIQLLFNGSDFDSDYPLFNVTFDSSMLIPKMVLNSNTTIISATVEPVISIGYDGLITEGNENGEIIQLSLSEGKFKSSVSIESITLTGLPEGVSISSLQLSSETQLIFELSGVRSSDYDTDISNIQCQIKSEIFQNYYQEGEIELVCDIVFLSYNEQLNIFHEGLTENNLDGAILQLSLIDDYFTDANISPANITLNNAPQGVTFDDVTYIDTNKATVLLKYDGTDVSNSIDNFNISINQEELHGLENLQSNSLLIEEGVGIFSEENFWNLKIFAKFASVFVTIDDVPKKWESASITVFDSKGKRVFISQLNQTKVNKVDLNVLTGYYMVLVRINGKEFINKVFILPE